jgi:hypothetical protein
LNPLRPHPRHPELVEGRRGAVARLSLAKTSCRARFDGLSVTGRQAQRAGLQPSREVLWSMRMMLKKDLTTSYPRSVKDKVLGVVQLGRAIDKGIAFANGTQGEYNYDCPMDRTTFAAFGIDANGLLDAIKKAQSEADVIAYLKPFVEKKSAAEIEVFNTTSLANKPAPGSDGEAYFLQLRGQVAPDRVDVTTWADLLDLDEKRDVPKRAA